MHFFDIYPHLSPFLDERLFVDNFARFLRIVDKLNKTPPLRILCESNAKFTPFKA